MIRLGLALALGLLSPGFEHFYNNEYDQALTIFEDNAQKHPADAAAQNAVAQAILYREMFRNGALESQLVTGSNAFLRRGKMEISAQDRSAFAEAITQTLSLTEARLKEDPNDVHALYQTAVAHGLRANYLFLVEKSWMQALHETIAGRKANEKILDIDPSFIEARLLHGLSEYVVSCLPAYLRMLGAVNGFHGDRDDGIRQLEMVRQSQADNRFDAAILLAVIYRREHRPKDALPLLEKLATDFPRNYLFRLEQVQIYSDLGDKTAALGVLAGIENAIKSGAAGYAKLSVERVEYARGNLLFWYDDLQAARENLDKASRHSERLDLNTAVMAWLRLGQVYDLQGDHDQARQAYKSAMATAPDSDPAKEAAGYMAKPYKRKLKT